MKILVIDDTRVNLEAAKQTISSQHELTLASSYDEAYKLLEKPKDGGPPPFDVVLTDLLMPAGSVQQGGEGAKYVGQEMPVGFALALMAVLHGAKLVAVVTDLDHHKHPAAAMLDRLGSDGLDGRESDFVRIHANGVPVGFVNYAPKVRVETVDCEVCGGVGTMPETTCRSCEGNGKAHWLIGGQCNPCKGSGRETTKCSCYKGKSPGKDWGRVLESLLKWE